MSEIKTPTWRCLITVVCGLISVAGHAQVRDFPNRPIRVIVPSSSGGISDMVIRLIAPKLTEIMGQSVVVENRPGASTNIGTELTAHAAGDGYTLLINSLPLVVNPSLFSKLPFNVEKDLAPVSLIVAAPYVLVVHPSVPARTVNELIVLAKAKPGALHYSSGGNGTNLHIAAELFKNLSGIDINHVPYKGGGPALISVLGSETDLSFLSPVAVLPHISTGRLRALGITSSRRSPLLPELPTVAETGVAGFEFTAWVGVLAPAATPTRIVAMLNSYFLEALRSPSLIDHFAKEGIDIVASSPVQFGAQIKSDLVRWAKVVRQSGMRAD